MKTTFDLEDILYQAINNSSLKSAINGGVYKRRRPTNPTKEDVVIVSLPVNNLQLQSAVVNVNIHVPNKPVRANGVDDNDHADHARMKALAAIAVDFLTYQWGSDYNYDVQQQNVFEDDEGDSHYINIRLDFNSINVSN